jgi:hypothetical protein
MVVVSEIIRCLVCWVAVASEIVTVSLNDLITVRAGILTTPSLIVVLSENRRVLFAKRRIESETLTISGV